MRKGQLLAAAGLLVVLLGFVSTQTRSQIIPAPGPVNRTARIALHGPGMLEPDDVGNVQNGKVSGIGGIVGGGAAVMSIQDVQEGVAATAASDAAGLKADLREIRAAVRAVSQMEARIQSSLTQLERRQEDIHAELHEIVQGQAAPQSAAEGIAMSDMMHSSGDPGVPIDPDDPWLARNMSNVVSSNLELTDSFKKALDQMPRLPKRWDDKNLLKTGIPMITHGVGAMVKANPSWVVRVWTNVEIDDYIKAHVARHDWNLIKQKHIVEKTDLWRLLVLYHIGGLYQDLDRSYNKGPFSSLIRPETKMYFPMHHDVNFAQDLMITAPRNPVVKAAIELNLKYRRLWAEQGGKGPRGKESQNIIELGPNTLFYAATSIMFGTRLNVNIRDENGNRERAGDFVRDAMRTSPYLQTYREEGNATICDQVFFYHTECATTWPRKKEFLDHYHRQQWDHDVDR